MNRAICYEDKEPISHPQKVAVSFQEDPGDLSCNIYWQKTIFLTIFISSFLPRCLRNKYSFGAYYFLPQAWCVFWGEQRQQACTSSIYERPWSKYSTLPVMSAHRWCTLWKTEYFLLTFYLMRPSILGHIRAKISGSVLLTEMTARVAFAGKGEISHSINNFWNKLQWYKYSVD